jgi:formamidopyrimidine-DNA glycosylase
MPELPEVETTVRRLRQPLIGRTFTGTSVMWPPMVRPPGVELNDRLPGQRIQSIRRRAKYLVFELSGGDRLIIHLKMSGDLRVCEAADALDRHDRIVFELDDGNQLRFNDTRKFGRVYLLAEPGAVLGRLGPEPLSGWFGEADFLALFERRSGRIKPLLMDQTFIAGIGNIYADESLFEAGIHPLRAADTLSETEKRRLYHAIRQVLSLAIRHQGSTLRDATYREGRYQDRFCVYGQHGRPCARCGSMIERVRVGQRYAHFCPACQQ